jgi:hypothetical protein
MMGQTLDPELTHVKLVNPKPKRQSKLAMLDGDEWPGPLGQALGAMTSAVTAARDCLLTTKALVGFIE